METILQNVNIQIAFHWHTKGWLNRSIHFYLCLMKKWGPCFTIPVFNELFLYSRTKWRHWGVAKHGFWWSHYVFPLPLFSLSENLEYWENQNKKIPHAFIWWGIVAIRKFYFEMLMSRLVSRVQRVITWSLLGRIYAILQYLSYS